MVNKKVSNGPIQKFSVTEWYQDVSKQPLEEKLFFLRPVTIFRQH